MSSLFTMRAWLVLVGICIMGSLNAFLISKEHIETVMVEDNDIEYDDRLGDLVYSKGNRESNLSSFGLNSDQIKESKKYFRRYEKMETQIRARLKKSDEDLTEVFCSRTEEIRPRYAGLSYLILEDNGERIVWDPKSNNEFNAQSWAAVVSFETIYEDIEKGRTELPSSTVMVATAFVSGNEEMLISRQEPWGRSGRSWDWAEVQKQFGASLKLSVQYLSILHYVTEIANGEDGICQ